MGIFLDKVTDQRQMLALTGLSKSEFTKLLENFTIVFKKSRELALQDKLLQTDRSGGGILADDADKLFFVLFFMKTYPTFDVLSYQFACCRATAWNYVDKLLPILMASLASLGVLPARLFESQEAMELAFAKADKILLDATERPTQRPKDKDLQVQKYSGKKKPIP